MPAVLRYPGAKWSVADWIIGLMPPHKSYLEPFFGSGAVFFGKEPAPIETVNDIDGEICNLFSVIRERPEELATALALTPYARQEYETAWALRQEPAEPVELARRMLIRYWQTHGSSVRKKAGWKNDVTGREAAYAVRNWNRLPAWVMEAALRLKDAQIEQKPAVELIQRFRSPEVLIYADPPYLLQTRRDLQYRHEMTEADHLELLRVLLEHPGPVLLSGYDSELYRDMLTGWDCFRHPAQALNGAQRTECLWVNYEIQLRLEM